MQQAERAIKLPDATHPITLSMTGAHVLVKSGGRIVADTRRAVTFTEAKYPPVQYIPRDDVDMTLLEPTGHRSYCPYKGEATYFTIQGIGERGINAVWSYVGAYPAAAQIDGYLAFYPDRVDSIDVLED